MPPGFVALSVLQLALMAGVVAIAFIALRPLENNPLPLWDGGAVAGTGIRSAAVGSTSLCGRCSHADLSGLGAERSGVYCVAVMVVALVTARWLASTRRIAAQY